MSATVETPTIPAPIHGPTRAEPLIETLLLDDYRTLVHLAYLILPAAISRARRVVAAHAVVQRALPPGLTLPADGLGFDPCAIRADRTAIRRRCARGGRVAMTFTLLLTLGILVSFLMS